MAFDLAILGRRDGSWGVIAALVVSDGSAAQPVPRRLAPRENSTRDASPRDTTPREIAARDVADAMHALCLLHGHSPGLIEHAARCAAQPPAKDWLVAASRAFTVERTYVTHLAAVAGHVPSTPGQAESEAAIVGQRHALEMLAQSERAGCATGAVVALLLDWGAIRDVLDAAAMRFGITPPPVALPLGAEIETVVSALGDTPGVERAMAFGAQQLLAQHRGLWHLLEARASARDRH